MKAMPVSLVVKVMMIISKVIEVMLVTHVVILAEVLHVPVFNKHCSRVLLNLVVRKRITKPLNLIPHWYMVHLHC